MSSLRAGPVPCSQPVCLPGTGKCLCKCLMNRCRLFLVMFGWRGSGNLLGVVRMSHSGFPGGPLALESCSVKSRLVHGLLDASNQLPSQVIQENLCCPPSSIVSWLV